MVISSVSPPAISEVLSSQSNVSYYGGNDGTATLEVEGGTGEYNYTWTPDIGLENGQGTNSASGLEAGTYNLVVQDKNQMNNKFSKTFTISEMGNLIKTSLNIVVPNCTC